MYQKLQKKKKKKHPTRARENPSSCLKSNEVAVILFFVNFIGPRRHDVNF